MLEAATGTRSADPATGEAIYDYMAQKQVYIVLHASGKVSSTLRRHWKEIEATVRLEDIAPHPEDADPDEHPLLILGPVDVLDRTPVRPTARLEHQELRDAIPARLSPAQTKIFRFLDAGYEPPEIAELLKLDRRTIHAHIEAIRKATEIVGELESDGVDMAILTASGVWFRRRAQDGLDHCRVERLALFDCYESQRLQPFVQERHHVGQRNVRRCQDVHAAAGSTAKGMTEVALEETSEFVAG